MQRPPVSATLLTAAGALPFLCAAATTLTGTTLPAEWLPPGAPSGGKALAVSYGIVILSFMSGVLWGFAAPNARLRWLGLALSVLPALYAFGFVAGSASDRQQALMIGFAAILPLDALFQWLRLAPGWWLTLRIPVTIVVFICLALA